MSNDTQATPGTLDEAIILAITIGPMKDMNERIYVRVKDFLAQRFGVAMLEAPTSEEADRLDDLFKKITRRP